MCAVTAQPLLKTGVKLVVETAPELPSIYSDQDKVRQILLNLLSNAAKFTHEGQISINAFTENDMLTIAVDDTGIGVAEDKLETIFEEFSQADATTTRKYGGTGLGLAISRRLARLLGGDLVVNSQVEAGSTFTLTIAQNVGGAGLTASLRETANHVREPVGSLRKTHAKPVVLAIDDDPGAVELLQQHLADAGFAVVGAGGAEQGLTLARQLKPFAITLSIQMPEKDGWQILSDLNADPVLRSIPVILLAVEGNRPRGFRLAASEYLVKPLEETALQGALSRLRPFAARRLLVVDDDPNIADMVRQLLEGREIEIDAAADGEEAMAAIQRQRPDIVLLDLMMPRLDGFGVLQQIRANADYADIPVAVLTARSLSAADTERLRQGMSQVMHKNRLDSESLLDQLEWALK
jgi:CheY-like chemotaxis protein/anti-sigma regulatory factor (Ser/Thr protein kinase)